ncbi:MAG: malate synthase A [Acidobacteria bacterium]|nr:malate synthase A [Acidobacteriota bacterium]
MHTSSDKSGDKSAGVVANAPEAIGKLVAEGIECVWPPIEKATDKACAAFAEILTPNALRFVADLERKFGARRRELLARRVERQRALDAGQFPDFLPETKSIRDAAWTVTPAPADLQDRRVEITGPVDRKMVINALNSGAKVFMADLEDAHAPTWEATIQGQANLRDAVCGSIEFTNPDGAVYKLKPTVATLLVRPRGWHLTEKHIQVDGQAMSASLCDFGLYFFHNAKARLERGTAPYFYLPKLESHLEARLWNDVFIHAQRELGIAQGTIKATVLIETILAAFEMDEILYELREHSTGLNCGRWDYIFSFIKKFKKHPAFVLPDRAQVSMTRHFLRSYSLLVIKTCHRRGAHAIGGMAAQIPIKNDVEANAQAIAKVYDDKEREAADGHDGTWVAHPGLVPVALEVFNQEMPVANQVSRQRDDVQVSAADLLKVPRGTITESGLRTNLRVGVQYLEAWLRGAGCVPLYNLMEDAATAEISRAQVWQWIRHAAKLPDGRVITREMARKMLDEEMAQFRAALGADRYATSKFTLARELFEQISTQDEFVPFLTLPAYEHLD